MSSSEQNWDTAEPAARPARATGETAILSNVQYGLDFVPGARAGATALSHWGEHALGWFAVAAGGMVLQPEKRGRWAMVGAGTFAAHASSVLLKRVVRRRRPMHPEIQVRVGTPSTLSFPSSHATSTTAFAVLAQSVTGAPIVPVVVPPMLVSRLVLGVHYPSDVLAGAALGAGTALLTRGLWPADAVQRLLPAFARDVDPVGAGPTREESEEMR